MVSEGDDFESAVAAVMKHARTLVAQAKQSSLGQEEDEELKALASDFKPEWMENWYDGLGFCASRPSHSRTRPANVD